MSAAVEEVDRVTARRIARRWLKNQDGATLEWCAVGIQDEIGGKWSSDIPKQHRKNYQRGRRLGRALKRGDIEA